MSEGGDVEPNNEFSKRLEELAEQLNHLVGIADDWRAHEFGHDGDEELQKIADALDKVANAAERADDRTDTDPSRQLVYANARRVAARVRYLTPSDTRPQDVGNGRTPGVRANDPVGRVHVKDDEMSFEPASEARFRVQDTIAIYGENLDGEVIIRFDGDRAEVQHQSPDCIVFEVPEEVSTGETRVQVEVDGERVWDGQVIVE
jgi:hypothetical protein